MVLDLMDAGQVRTYMNRLRRTQAALLASGEGVLASTMTPTIRRVRSRLDVLQAFA